jgi:membrane protein DedA with SNARE-associated domain
MAEDGPSKSRLQVYTKYSGMVFQLLALITLAYFLGQWLDKKAGNETAYLTALCLLLSIFLYLYALIKDLKR